MPMADGGPVIAIEEHYLDPEASKHYELTDAAHAPHIAERLPDLGALRLKEMDEAGIDLQVLSLQSPATQRMAPDLAVSIARGANDRLAETVRARPDRFDAFAALPTPDPKAAADELERAVTRLGFKGAMIHGLTNGRFLDDNEFWPIFERARDLDVPLYIHPATPHPDVVRTYYQDYVDQYPMFQLAACGFTMETAVQGIRIVLSGLLDAYPGVKIILGHLGETLPFSLWRIDQSLSFFGKGKPSGFRDAFCEHFWITTSGHFSTPAFLCCLMELGVDRILFSVDWPFVPNAPGTKWVEGLPVSAEDKEKILGGNAKRLLKLGN